MSHLVLIARHRGVSGKKWSFCVEKVMLVSMYEKSQFLPKIKVFSVFLSFIGHNLSIRAQYLPLTD